MLWQLVALAKGKAFSRINTLPHHRSLNSYCIYTWKIWLRERKSDIFFSSREPLRIFFSHMHWCILSNSIFILRLWMCFLNHLQKLDCVGASLAPYFVTWPSYIQSHTRIGSESTREPEVVVSGESPIVCIVVRVRVHVSVCGSVPVSVLLWSDPAARGWISVHLPRHRSDVFSVTVALAAVSCVDGVQCAAACVPGPVALRAALSVAECVIVSVVERGVALHVYRRSATWVSMCVSVIVAFPV